MSGRPVGASILGLAVWLLASALCQAQPAIKIVGSGTGGLPVNVGATSIGLGQTSTEPGAYLGTYFSEGGPMAADANGNLYVSTAYTRVYQVNPSGKASVVAGTGVSGFSNGGGNALSAQFGNISAMVVDTSGNLYVADSTNFCVWKVNLSAATISIEAGIGTLNATQLFNDSSDGGTNSGDGGPASQAGLGSPEALALDQQGNLYILTPTAVRKVALATGIISTFYMTDSSLAWPLPSQMAIDSAGTYMYLSNQYGGSLYQVALCSGAVTATSLPTGLLTSDAHGNVYVLDEVYPAAIYKVAAGGASASEIVDLNALANSNAFLSNYEPGGFAVDGENNLYFWYGVVWKSNTSGAAPAVYGGDESFDYNGDGPALQATFSDVSGIAADHIGNIYFSDTQNQRVRKINLATGTVSTVAGTSLQGYTGDGGKATSAQLSYPGCLAVDGAGQNLYITDGGNLAIRHVNLVTGNISTLVGPATSNAPDGFLPTCIALDGTGANLYVVEYGYNENVGPPANRLDQVVVSTGQLTSSFGPENLAGNAAAGMAADSSGNVYVAYPPAIYRFTSGVSSLFANTSGTEGDSGDGGAAAAATFGSYWLSLALDGNGNLFIGDVENGRIRRVTNGTVYTVTADPGLVPSSLVSTLPPPVNGEPLACAYLLAGSGIAADGSGNLFVPTNSNSSLIVEAADWAGAPAATVAETLGVSPSTEGLAVTVDGSPLNASTVQNWSAGSTHNLSAPATQAGQDGYTYSFVGWSDGSALPSRSVTAGTCPATYTARYSQPDCQFTLSPNLTVDQAGGAGIFYLMAPPGSNCSWTAQSNASWIALASGSTSGTGSGAVAFAISQNSGAQQSGTITAGGQTYTITELGSTDCVYSLESAPSSAAFPAAGGSNIFQVNVIGSDCPASWQATSAASWLHVTSATDVYIGSVNYTADPYTGTAARTGMITVAVNTTPPVNLPFNVTQEPPGASNLVLTSTAITAPPNGGPATIGVSEIAASCDMWSAVSNVPWITITTTASGNSGGGQVGYIVAANTGVSRQGTMTIAGTTVTVTQAGGTCNFSLTSPSANAPVGGGTGSFGLTTADPFCFWSAGSNQSWLTVTSALSGSGATTVDYSAASTTTTRSANITVGGQTFTVTQTAGFTVTFATVPAGLQVMVDGSSIQSSTVTLSGSHMISVASPQSGPSGTQYVFTQWSDSNTSDPRSIDVTAPITYTADFQTQYQLTITASPAADGTVSPASGTYYPSGQSVPIVATPASGYQFSSWTGTVASSSSASTTVTMSAPETVTANFIAGTAITIQTTPAGLQFSVDGGAAQTAPQTVNLSPGSHTIAVSATQAGAAGIQYVFTSWSDSNTSNPRTITATSSAATYTATFQTQYQLTISASPAAGGSATPATGGYYNAGTSVPLTATANTGYSFSGWSGSVVSSNSPSTMVTMSAPETVVANFSSVTGITIQTSPPDLQFTVDGGAAQTAPQTLNLTPGSHTIAVAATQPGATGVQYTFLSWSDTGAASHSITVGSSAATYTATFQTQYQLTVSASPFAGGTVTPTSATYYNSGASVPITATAASGYTFSGWTGSVASSTSASTTVTMSAPEAVTANFISLSGITIQTTPEGLQFTVDGGAPQTAPQTLTLSQGPHTIALATTQAGTVGTQYTFLAWSDSGLPSHTITVGTTPATYIATFQTQYQLTISASPAADGTVTPATGGFYNAGSSVPITATAASGFQFSSWTGSVASSTSASTTVTMSAPETVTANFTAVTTTSGLAFYPVTPCRVADTRNPTGPFGGPILSAGTRSFAIPSSGCNIPTTAQAYSLNITVVPATTLNYLTAWPTGQTQPYVSTLNSSNGAIIANAGIVPAGTGGGISIYVSDATNVIIDINGYFAAPAGSTALAFYPVTPCRVADTRNPNGPFGGPSLAAVATRNFTVPQSACNIPATAQAYSLNMTVVPPGPLEYLSAWPTGQTQPVVSTLNAIQGQIAANAAIVPAGTNGSISVFVSDPTNVVIDINGYFGPPGSPGALYFYPVTPCRVADTRNAAGTFGGPSMGAGSTRTFPIPSSSCGLPSAAQAYSLNMTVVPPGSLLYLSTWPAGQSQPVVSTLNDLQGQIIANAAIVPAGTSGGISIFVSDATNLVIDINGYFGQ